MSTDQEIFDSITSDEAPAVAGAEIPAVVEAPVQEAGSEQPRDEQGKFASKGAEEPQSSPDAGEVQPKNDASIPAWRVSEITQERNALREETARIKAENAALQSRIPQPDVQKPQIPDMFADPDAYTAYQERQRDEAIRAARTEWSLEAAHDKHGDDFLKAYDALKSAGASGDRISVQRVLNSNNPGKALMQWHQHQTVLAETGGDLNGYAVKLQEKLLSDPDFLAKAGEQIRARAEAAGQQARPGQIVLPPSISRMSSAASDASGALDDSDEAIFRSV